jgi:hypothetical protein
VRLVEGPIEEPVSSRSFAGGWTTRTLPAVDYVCVGSLPELEAYPALQAYLE